MTHTFDDEREHKIDEALTEYKDGESSIRNLAIKYSLPRSTLRDRIKRANITKDNVCPKARRAAILKGRAKAISEKQFKDIKLRERETIIQNALDYYGTKIGEKEGLRSVAARFRIPRSTLRGRILGSISTRNRIQKGQKLSFSEEDVIVDCIFGLCSAGEEVSSSRVRNLANLLQQYRRSPSEQVNPLDTPVGVDPGTGKVNQVCLGWVRSFLGRHPTLIDAKGRILNAERTKAFTRDLFTDWFRKLKTATEGIPPRNVYNVDCTTIRASQLCTDGHRQIVSSSALPDDFVTLPQPESFKLVECISAEGKSLTPLLEFSSGSKYFTRDKLSCLPEISNWILSFQEDTVLTNENLLLKWFYDCFDKDSSKHLDSSSYKRIIIGDMPSARNSKRFQEACRSKNVEFICLPEFTSHELQPLDVGIFTKLKRSFCTKVEAFLKTLGNSTDRNCSNIPADELILCFKHARQQVLTKQNVQKSFSLSGIYPHNESIVLDRIWDPTSDTNVPYDFPTAELNATSNTSQVPSEALSNVIGCDTSSGPFLRDNSGHNLVFPNSSSCASGSDMNQSSMNDSSYRNLAISELIFSSSPNELELSQPTVLPVMKDSQLNQTYTSSESFIANPLAKHPAASAIDRHPLPSLPDALSNPANPNTTLNSLVEIAPLQSQSLLHRQVVPLPSLTTTISGDMHSPQFWRSQLLTSAHYAHMGASSERLSLLAQSQVTKSSSLDFICHKDP